MSDTTNPSFKPLTKAHDAWKGQVPTEAFHVLFQEGTERWVNGLVSRFMQGGTDGGVTTYYADLRPGNVRIGGRDRRARLLDAGSMVRRDDCSGRFPHVPAYLPPDVFDMVRMKIDRAFPTAAVQAVMAGRTLYEVATGRVPVAGEQVDLKLLWDSRVSQPVADTIDGLCSGSFSDVRQALRYLNKHAARRVPSRLVAVGAAAGAASAPLSFEDAAPTTAAPESRVPHAVAATPASHPETSILPPLKPASWWRRMFGG